MKIDISYKEYLDKCKKSAISECMFEIEWQFLKREFNLNELHREAMSRIDAAKRNNLLREVFKWKEVMKKRKKS